jgi:LytS/YehU family sensor histidine kinase
MISKLSGLYRTVLDSSKSATSPLDREIRIVTDFLDLQKMRFEDRIRYSVDVPEDASRIHVPSLLIHTLVENAVKHGIEKSREGGEIRVQVRREGTHFRCEIRNTGARLGKASLGPAASADGSGTGLENTRRRLQLLYGAAGRFELASEPEGATVASFFFTGEMK